MQDRAPSHTANVTQNYLKETFGTLYSQRSVASKFAWLQPTWFLLLGCSQAEGLRRSSRKIGWSWWTNKRIRQVWKSSIDVEALRKAILQIQPRLKAVVENGGPIKKTFWLNVIGIYIDRDYKHSILQSFYSVVFAVTLFQLIFCLLSTFWLVFLSISLFSLFYSNE